MPVHCQPLTTNLYDCYIETGKRAYSQHYLHLWKDRDASPYLQESFTRDTLRKEDADENTELFIIRLNEESVGVLKITKDKALELHSRKHALLLDKIYLLREHSGKGIGTRVLEFICQRAKALEKQVVWLDTMAKGPALQFYQNRGFEIHSSTQLRFHGVLDKERPMYRLVKKI